MPETGEAIAHRAQETRSTDRRAECIGNGLPALQDDDDDKQMHDQHHELDQRKMRRAIEAHHQGDIGDCDAGGDCSTEEHHAPEEQVVRRRK